MVRDKKTFSGSGDILPAFGFDPPVNITKKCQPPAPSTNVIDIEAPVVIGFREAFGPRSALCGKKSPQRFDRRLRRLETKFTRRALAGNGPVINQFAELAAGRSADLP